MLKLNFDVSIEATRQSSITGDLKMLASDFVSQLTSAEKLTKEAMLISEEHTLASELYTLLLTKYQMFNRYLKDPKSMILHRGVRVILDDEPMLVRLRRSLPLSSDIPAINLNNFPEYACHLRDLISRTKLADSQTTPAARSLHELAGTCKSEEEYLSKAEKINPQCSMIVSKYRLSKFTIDEMLERRAPIL